jgi:hypothetical protein
MVVCCCNAQRVGVPAAYLPRLRKAQLMLFVVTWSLVCPMPAAPQTRQSQKLIVKDLNNENNGDSDSKNNNDDDSSKQELSSTEFL